MAEPFYPTEENLGRDCMFWGDIDGVRCDFVNIKLAGRLSCEGIIDDVCLFVKDGRPASSLTEEQMIEIKTRPPGPESAALLPPGNTY